MTWICDRCQAETEPIPPETVFDPDFSPFAVHLAPEEWFGLDGWIQVADTEHVRDVCPGCQTGRDKAEHEARDRLFGDPP